MALTLGALALAFGGAAAIAPAAHADSSAKTSAGARATFTSSDEVFKLYDEKCDGYSVYLVYKLRGGSEQRIEFSGGCNKSGKYDKNFSEGSKVEYKACVNVNNARDKCSAWSTDFA
ncbi:hypothetical protein AB0M48_21500 [Lentzea sp. NPDC051208]|uniref:hypothetical protein n=1 Tax=Lentzea sp. NPDC051208 TaxID=3154642 RepID=UPI00341FE854